MKTSEQSFARERKTRIINFRIPPSAEAALSIGLDPGSGVTSQDKVARKILLQALAEQQQNRRLEALNVDTLPQAEIFTGDASPILQRFPSRMCRTCITSPPYWRQRDYGHAGQIGRERTVKRYISRLADVFDEVHRILSDDGTLWVVIADCYFRKQLVGAPWRLAFELQDRGWFWRAEIVWQKPGKPEGCKDRPTRGHETVLLLSKKRAGYCFNQMLEPHSNSWAIDCIRKAKENGQTERPRSDPFWSKERRRQLGLRGITRAEYGALMNPLGKNRRDVWSFNTEKHAGAHSAVMPLALAELCLTAGSKPADVVLDPFCGTGTTGVAAITNGRRFIGIDLVPRFVQSAEERIGATSAVPAGPRIRRPSMSAP